MKYYNYQDIKHHIKNTGLNPTVSADQALHYLYVIRNLPLRKVGSILGISRTTVRNHLKSLGIPRRSRGGDNRSTCQD